MKPNKQPKTPSQNKTSNETKAAAVSNSNLTKTPQDLLEVAVVGKIFGVKGALNLRNKSDFVEQFRVGAEFLLGDGRVVKIKQIHDNKAVFEGYEDANLAQMLVNQTLYRTKETTKKECKLKKGEFFYFDILECEVTQEGEVLGVVKDILESGAGYLLGVATSEALLDAGEAKFFYIPYHDNFIEKVDVSAGRIWVKNAKAILQNS